MSVRIQGFAAPYNVANCYGETFLPGCWETLIKSWGTDIAGKPLVSVPIHIMHRDKICIGAWDKVWSDETGLWCEGNVCEADYAKLKRVGLHQLSVDYATGPTSPLTKRRLKMELTFSENDPLPEALAEAVTNRAARCGYIDTAGGRRPIVNVEPVELITGLSEISFVDRGAFKETYWQVIS